jgi:hypothetical protein
MPQRGKCRWNIWTLLGTVSGRERTKVYLNSDRLEVSTAV